MRLWWTKREPDRRREIAERLTELFLANEWTAELRAEANRLRAELLALDEVPPAAELPPGRARRAVGDPAVEARRAAEREREAEAARWRRVVAMRGGWGMSRVVWDPERAARRRTEHTSSLVRDGFRPWR